MHRPSGRCGQNLYETVNRPCASPTLVLQYDSSHNKVVKRDNPQKIIDSLAQGCT
jgi:hypothetical protein